MNWADWNLAGALCKSPTDTFDRISRGHGVEGHEHVDCNPGGFSRYLDAAIDVRLHGATPSQGRLVKETTIGRLAESLSVACSNITPRGPYM